MPAKQARNKFEIPPILRNASRDGIPEGVFHPISCDDNEFEKPGKLSLQYPKKFEGQPLTNGVKNCSNNNERQKEQQENKWNIKMIDNQNAPEFGTSLCKKCDSFWSFIIDCA